MTKTITIGLVAIAFVAGSIMTGTMAEAAPRGNTPAAFFDVFFDVEPSVFFGIFGDPDFIFGDPDFAVDSFFDVFVELDARDRHFDTEIVALQLASHEPVDLTQEIQDRQDADDDLQSQIDALDARLTTLESGEYVDTTFSCVPDVFGGGEDDCINTCDIDGSTFLEVISTDTQGETVLTTDSITILGNVDPVTEFTILCETP